MSAEQWAGKPATSASDQFALCVTIWEGLYGTRPFTGSTRAGLRTAVEDESLTEPDGGADVPAWIRRILERGLAADPRQRWPSITALVEALDQGHRRAERRRWRLGLALSGIAIVGGIGLWLGLDARERARCRALGNEVEALWNDQVRASATKAMTEALPDYGPEAMRRVSPYLDRWTDTWSAARFETCRSLDETLRARAEMCLAEQRAAIALFSEKLQQPDRMFAYTSVLTASTLENPEPCVDPVYLRQQPEVQADATELMAELYRDLASATASNWEADHASSIATMRNALEKAKHLEHLPIRARLHGVLGSTLASTSKYDAAIEELLAAYRLAARADDLALTAMFADGLATVLGDELRRIEEARIWLEVAEAALARRGDDYSLEYADHMATIALVETAAENYDEGLEAFEELLRLRTNHLGPDHPDVAVTLADTALVYASDGRSEKAVQLLTEANAALAAAVGEMHPILATTTNTMAIAHLDLGRTDQAVQAARKALSIAEVVRSPGHSEIAMCRTTLGFALHENGEHAEALEESLKALADFEVALGKRHPHIGVVNTNIGEMYYQQGRLDAARRYFAVGLDIARAHEDADDAAMLELRLAQIVAAQGDTARARDAMTAALSALIAARSEEAAVEAKVALANLELDDGHPNAALELARTAWISNEATDEDRLGAALAFARALSESSTPDSERALRVAREALAGAQEHADLAQYRALSDWIARRAGAG